MFGGENPTGLRAGEFRGEDSGEDWYDDGDPEEVIRRLTVAEMSRPATVERQLLPDGFEEIPPGPYLAVLVEAIDRSRLNGHDLVRVLQARERLTAHLQAGSAADSVEIAYATPGAPDSAPSRDDEPAEFAADEVRAALTLTRRAAEDRVGLSFDLIERLPLVWWLFDRGDIDLARARVIVNGTSHLNRNEAREIVEILRDQVSRLTTGQLAALIRRLCVDTDAVQARRRYETAVENRRLWIEQTVDGTGNLHLLDIPIRTASAIGRRINGHMISLKKDGVDRGHDQIRADIACDLLLGADPDNGGRGLVDLRIDLTTLAGLDDKAAEVPGLGPVVADVARQMAMAQPRAEWRYTVVDEHGEVVSTGVTRRRPDTSLTRHLQTSQPTCVFPGCRMPARDCDLDHERPWSKGGQTRADNLSPKCRHDHVLKDHGWDHRRTEAGHTWTSPMGHTYIASGRSP